MVAQEVLRQGGSKEQAWVAAALVSGIESNGDPTELSGGVGPAAGLFQFEPGTWVGNGGGAFAPVAQDATWQQQVTVFLHASAGNNFHDWGPDLTGQGDPNSAANPSYSYSGPPKAGSPVANKIATLAATDKALGNILGNVPQSWADAGGVVPASPTPLGPLGAGVNVGGNIHLGWADALGNLLSDLVSVDWWKRVGLFAAGAFLVIAGVVLFIQTTETGQRVESEGIQAAEMGAVAA